MQLRIHGLDIAVESHPPELGPVLLRPFKFFQVPPGREGVRLVARAEAPPYASFPPTEAKFSSPRNVVYQEGNRKIVDYFGRGAVVVEEPDHYALYSESQGMLAEILYLLILSLLGQHCDRHRLLRIHALGLSYNDTAVLMMLPQGGGKSTIMLSLMQESDVKFISDDDPIYHHSGRILPFPRPLGILHREVIAHVPEEFIYSTDRMEFGVKYLVDIDYWRHRIEERPLSRIVLCTVRRVLNGVPAIRPASRWEALRSLIRDAVVGVGLYQGVEFLFSHSTWEVLGRVHVGLSRLWLALDLVRRARTFELTLGPDVAQNTAVVRSFLGTMP